MGISGCNVSLPPEAFKMAESLTLDPTQDEVLSLGQNPRPLGLGVHVQRLIDFNLERQQATCDHTLNEFWKPLVAKYFSHDASLHINIMSRETKKDRPFRLPVETLPHVWKCLYDEGATEERILFENPCEYITPTGNVSVICSRTVIITTYDRSMVVTNGHLRVSFLANKKISSWSFHTTSHQELFTGNVMVMNESPYTYFEYGFPAAVFRVLSIADVITQMEKKIAEEIAKLVSDPSRITSSVNRTPALQIPATVSAAQDAESQRLAKAGSAYRTLLSQLDGPDGGPPENLLTGTVTNGMGGTDASNVGMGGFPGTFEDITSMLGGNDKDVGNGRDAMSTWRQEQSGKDILQTILEQTEESTLVPSERGNGRRRGNQGQAGDVLNRSFAAGMTDEDGRGSGQTVFEAVNAAASGQEEWGIGVSSGCGIGNGSIVRDEVESSLHLLNVGRNSRRTEVEEREETDVSRQADGSGLGLFKGPEEADGVGDGEGARAGLGSEDLVGLTRAGVNRGNNGEVKTVEEGEGLGRRGSGKSKRESASGSHANGRGSSHAEVMGGGRGRGETNGGGSLKGGGSQAEGGKAGKGGTRSSGGSKRGSQRKSNGGTGADGAREKRQKTTAASAAEQA